MCDHAEHRGTRLLKPRDHEGASVPADAPFAADAGARPAQLTLRRHPTSAWHHM
ncbi:hypothetical protein SGR_377 [Streptomyces griseus subsp. griseus NBRC 13350]|uniref:Uncharacterized protein n=1 Tax=Streptomyces griseus subsp. griseus (strain JCM 4626 / CBS 651.72 / NBRC 13350 / KCC S-0626 / ISP 5235) TaxID=455632 RepID=B1VQA5_STRGG|nr:hypothetical protein SGR_377 [Streptomyces griseus subsp. griseus NBRC 13350]